MLNETTTTTNYSPIFEPIIGVIANIYPDNDDESNKAYIYHTHISSIEENGGKVIPILPWYTEDELNLIFSKINGVLMQGGSRNLNLSRPFEQFNKYILDYAISHNLSSDNPFPIWCTCQGIELLYAILYNNVNILSKFNSWNYFIPMKFDLTHIKASKMFSLLDEEELNIFKTKPCTVHLHNYGIDYEISQDFVLADEYKNIVNLNVFTHAEDREGKSFIGSVEDSRLNIFAMIFHPEQIPHNYCLSVHEEIFNEESVKVNSKIEKALVEISRKNKNRFESEEEKNRYKVIENSSRMNFEVNKMSEEDYEYEFIVYDRNECK